MTKRSHRSKGIRRRSLETTEAEEAFAREYARLEVQRGHSRVGAMAYRRLHPSAKGSTARPEACRLLRRPAVQRLIKEIRAKAAEKVVAELAALIDELRNVAFANPLDYLTINERGEPVIDLSALTPEQAAAIAETTVENFTDARGERKREVRRVKVRHHDKLAAIRLLAQISGHLKDRIEHEAGPTLADLVAASYAPKAEMPK